MFVRKPVRRVWIYIAPLLLIAALLAVLAIGSMHLGQNTRSEEIKLAEQTVRRATVQCYALEGAYAPSLEYLEEHYSISLDESKYTVHYTYVAANLMPSITVLPVGQQIPLGIQQTDG